MASVKREDTSAGPRWRVRYRRPDGTETSRRFDRRGKAEDFAVKVEHDRRAGSYIDPAGPRTPFPEVVARYRAAARHAPATVAVRDTDLKRVIKGLGRYRIGQITEVELRALLDDLEADLAPATVERVWAWLTGIFGVAVRARLIVANPTVGLAPPSAQRPQLIPLEGDQVEAVMSALPGHYRAAAILAADAGLRQGEVFGLAPTRVGFLSRSRVVRVERQLLTLPGEPLHLALPKGRARQAGPRTRVVPVGESVTDALAEHMAAYGRAAAPDRVDGRDAELIFATLGGQPVRRNTFGDAWQRAVARAGLPAGVRFHDLRHYYAAVLIDAGLPEREIGARLGHSSAEVTARYGHLFRHADDRTRAAVDAAVARRRAAQ
jgi:integrase